MKTQIIPGFPPKSNPFHHDQYHMGTKLGSNCVIMHENHTDKPCKYIIIINTETGERMRVSLIGDEGLNQSFVEKLIS